MNNTNNKLLYYVILGITIISFIILILISNSQKEIIKNEFNNRNELIENTNEVKKINENYILNPNKNLYEYKFLVNTYEEKKDIAIWYSEKDFNEFKIKAPDGKIYDISNVTEGYYDEDDEIVKLHFYDIKPGRWEIAYHKKNIDSRESNYGYEYLIPNCSGKKEIKDGILIFNTISEYGKYNYTYKIMAMGTNDDGMFFANTLIEGEAITNIEEKINISKFLEEYSEDEIIVSVIIDVFEDIREFYY